MTLALDITVRRDGFEGHFVHAFERRCTVITGPSGAGKTTLFDAIAGVLRPSGGRITFDDAAWSDGERFVPPEARGIGYAFQEDQLFPHLDVTSNVTFGLRARPALANRIDPLQLLERLGLLAYGAKKPALLSGGERKRVAIARAILAAERLLLLDEPFGALDEANRARVRAVLTDVAVDHDLQLVVATHADLPGFDDAERLVITAGGITSSP